MTNEKLLQEVFVGKTIERLSIIRGEILITFTDYSWVRLCGDIKDYEIATTVFVAGSLNEDPDTITVRSGY